MKYKEGSSGNPNGRPKGSKNKVGSDLRERIINFLSNEFENVQNDFQKLKPHERIRLYCDLLQYGLPKLQAMTLDADITSNEEINLPRQVIFNNPHCTCSASVLRGDQKE